MTTPSPIRTPFLAAALLLLGWGCGPARPTQPVVTWRVPDDGRLPTAAIDGLGTVHLVYVKGAASGGDLIYVTRTAGASTWSEPVRGTANRVR